MLSNFIIRVFILFEYDVVVFVILNSWTSVFNNYAMFNMC